MSVHTPGPWVAEINRQDGGRIAAKDAFATTIAWIGPDTIDEHNKEVLSDEGAANARLVAAAPDLLAACKDAAELLARLAFDSDVPKETARAMHAAIAKAVGK